MKEANVPFEDIIGDESTNTMNDYIFNEMEASTEDFNLEDLEREIFENDDWVYWLFCIK